MLFNVNYRTVAKEWTMQLWTVVFKPKVYVHFVHIMQPKAALGLGLDFLVQEPDHSKDGFKYNSWPKVGKYVMYHFL